MNPEPWTLAPGSARACRCTGGWGWWTARTRRYRERHAALVDECRERRL